MSERVDIVSTRIVAGRCMSLPMQASNPVCDFNTRKSMPGKSDRVNNYHAYLIPGYTCTYCL